MKRVDRDLADKLLSGWGWTSEYRFCPGRLWRFDWARPDLMLALEWEGGVGVRGRHVRADGYRAGMRKYSVAALLGWRVVRVDQTIATVEVLEALNAGQHGQAAALLAQGGLKRGREKLGEKGRRGNGAERNQRGVHKAGARPGNVGDGVRAEGEGKPVRVRRNHGKTGDVRPQR